MKLKNKKAVVTPTVGFCKKCGEPLRSTNKRGLCENCRRERAKAFRENGKALAVLGLVLIPGVKHFIGKK